MRDESQTRSSRLAVLIDADNASAEIIESLLKEVAKYGTAYVKRIYGDWTTNQLSRWKEKLNKFAIQPIQQFGYTTGKNSTDCALIIDAMDLLYTGNFDGFCLVSSDSDYTRLASRIRESGLLVYGFGEKKTPEAFISACDKFIYTEILRLVDVPTETTLAETKAEQKIKEDLRSTTEEETEPKSHSKLKANKKLMNLLKDAYEAVDEEDGWAHLGPLGAQLTKLSPSFDSRNYGYKKLSDLIQAVNIFEIKRTQKSIRIKLKA